MSFDVIGDIHGHAGALEALLTSLGYGKREGAWRHPLGRRAVFLGDFIDRGPRQVDAVDIPRRMVEAGSALAVMGNHEFNAIAWSLQDPDRPGEYLRRRHRVDAHGFNSNRHQHETFLEQVGEDSPLHRELVAWFLTLPLWLDLGGLRVVHACWHREFMAYLEPMLAPGQRLPVELMGAATREPEDRSEKDTPEPSIFKAVEATLKGLETPLPPPHSIRDADRVLRDRVRVSWWDTDKRTYRETALLRDHLREHLPDLEIPEHVRLGHDEGSPVLFGHYWMVAPTRALGPKVACVDYSIARNGHLVAYRWDGEPVLDESHFVAVGA